MVSSDARNKERALSRIKRIASSGLPVEPFARAIFEQLHAAIPYSPNKSMLIAGPGGADAFIASTPETAAVIPPFQHYFVERPAISGTRFRQDPVTIRRVLPRQSVWRHEEIATPNAFSTEGFNEVMRPIKWHRLLQIVFRDEGHFAGYVPLWRSEGEKDYTRADVDFLRLAEPHISHGLKVAQLQREIASADQSFLPRTDWNAGVILLDDKGYPVAMDTQARLTFQQIGGLDGVGAGAFHLAQIRDAFAYVAATLRHIFHDPDSGITHAAAPAVRVYAHWSGIVLKLHGLQMMGADGCENTAVLVERGQTAEARRGRIIARWGLSQREIEVLSLITDNKTGLEIAALLGVGHDTVRKHTSSILAKLAVESRSAAASVVREFV